jgi:hypothetical protein
MPYLLAGPFVALVGIVAVFFVLRRKSVEKRSMYSARRSQIEHKVRAARQRTLTPRGRGKPAEQTIPAGEPSPFATQTARTVAYQAPAYSAPPVAPPAPTQFPQPEAPPSQSPWDGRPAQAPTFDYPPAPPEPAYAPPQAEPAYAPPQPEPYQPAPSEPSWTPAPAPAPPAELLEQVPQQTAAAGAAGSWSVVSTEKEAAATVSPDGRKKKQKGGDDTGAWQLASGDAPGAEADEPELGRSNSTLMAVAQYAVLVIGLVMVLIGVIVMVANSRVT